ncbi:hypothetical protein [Mucilaginibacter jinjuensis]|uniref:Uncharacterized protein n=1 Tax=Mucilaginibacter jinjuensis TaxID=1176721 RepID=A0ABY7TF29_9SPHI|nr:hypothetical protein [Mucilaginibacter jinjuensis]WCT14921.1 hypothetical protein PQO05_13340 [Mucilaginibacter jinjuensis]
MNTADKQMINIKTVRFDRGLFIVAILICLILSAAILLSFSAGHPFKIILLGSIIAFIVSYCSYPFILKYYTSQTSLFFSDSRLIKQQADQGMVDFIDWDAMKSYQIHAFESLYGSGFTLTVHPKKGPNRKMSFIGVSLMDDYNIQNPGSLIFKLTQNINDYNKQQLSQNQILLLPGFFASSLLTYLLSIFSVLVLLAFVFYSVSYLSSENKLILFLFPVIIATTFYSKRRKARILYEKLYRLHSR